MAYRGRLIFPVLVEVFRLDRAAMAADPDGGGPLTSGWDPDYKEPILETNANRTGAPRRVEMAAVRIPAQVETETYDRVRITQTGDVKAGRMVFVIHFEELERLSLVSPTTGICLLVRGDRVGGTYTPAGALIQTFPDPPGLYVIEPQVIFGLGQQRNLLALVCGSRDQGGSG